MASKITSNNPEHIVDGILRGFLRRRFKSGFCTSTADAIASTMMGKKIQNYYHFDITEAGRLNVAKQYLRGILADHKGV